MSSKDKVAILWLNWLSDVGLFNSDGKLFQSIELLYLKLRFRKLVFAFGSARSGLFVKVNPQTFRWANMRNYIIIHSNVALVFKLCADLITIMSRPYNPIIVFGKWDWTLLTSHLYFLDQNLDQLEAHQHHGKRQTFVYHQHINKG